VPEIRLQRPLRVPADPAAEALGEMLKAIAGQQGMWRGFALHVGLGELRLPDVGYVAVPIDLTAVKVDEPPRTFDIAFVASNLPTAFPALAGKMSVEPAGMGESTLFLNGSYELPAKFFGRLLDVALMPSVAQRSLENFVDEIAAACVARVDKREAEFARYHFYTQTMR
jgi:hypothetical protein